MIVPMVKVYVVAQGHDGERLLETLGNLGVLHLEPVHPQQAVVDGTTQEHLNEIVQAIRILEGVAPSGPEVADAETTLHVAQEAILLHKTILDEREQLASLHREADQLTPWGNVRRADLISLREAGVPLRFLYLPAAAVGQIEAPCHEVVGQGPGPQILVAVVDRDGTVAIPEGGSELPWPQRDLPTVRQAAAALDESLRANQARLGRLATHLSQLRSARADLERQAAFTVAERSGVSHGSLFALQGWTPQTQAAALGARLAERSLPAAVEILQPDEDETPPTLIAYPRWARPIKALFDVLGTLPGYDEIDLSPFFMVCLPLFAAMLIGDAGYGLVLLIAGLAFYRKLCAAAGRPSAHLLIIFGAATLAWGVLTANYFGVTPPACQPDLIDGAEPAGLAAAMIKVAPLWRLDAEAGRTLIMKLSLLIGCIHLVLAHLRRVVELFPDVRAYAEIAWAVILGDMLAIIWFMMFPATGTMPGFLGYILLGGVVTVSWFGEPHANPVKRILTGFASAILPLLGTFSDIMSYIRLFAVGLASYYIAAAFNGLGAQVAASATWAAGAPIVIFGHALNLGLAAIAIFAHGVRLNMLEFSNNVGVKWAGYAYRPFTR